MQTSSKRARVDDERVPSTYYSCHNGSHLSIAAKDALSSIATSLAAAGKGITACDESAGTIGKRFEEVGVANTEENRRQYRQMLFETPDAAKYLSGAILDPETLLQKSSVTGEFFPSTLSSLGIVPGVKPHLKVYALPGTRGDTVMQGLDSLALRLAEYYSAGARFTKWRAPFEIDVSLGRPTRFSIEANMRDLARFALISQAEGLVPIVEPDVVLTGDHDLAVAVAVNTEIASVLYHSMLEQGVFMEGCILKVNMINPGLSCGISYTVEEIAAANLEVLQRTMPTAIPGVNYLSGGQSLADACARLSAINKLKTKMHPWNISFSWSAAIQMPLLAICKGHQGDLAAAIPEMQALYIKELQQASQASLGTYDWGEQDGAHFPGKTGAGSD